MKISFITTCKGRAFHLKQTYLRNIKVANQEYDNVEFVLVNYDSPDDLDEWVTQNLSDLILIGKVKYIRIQNKKYYSHPHATNIGVRLSEGEVVVVLEADNFLLSGFVASVVLGFRNGLDYMKFERKQGGSTSRIAINKKIFNYLNGFNESLSGWGYDDMDFFYRLSLLKYLKYEFFDKKFIAYIDHKSNFRRIHSPYLCLPIHISRNINVLKSKISIFFNGIIANKGRIYGNY